MKTTEIAKILFRMYGMTWSEAMKEASDMVFHQGAYNREAEEVMKDIAKKGQEYIKEKSGLNEEPDTEEAPEYLKSDTGTDDDWIDDGEDYDDTEDLEAEFDELMDLVENTLETDKYEAEQSEKLLKDIFEEAKGRYGKAETMRMLNDGYPDLKDDVADLILAIYKGNGYSIWEGKLEGYKSKIKRIEGILGVKSAAKWWEN